MVSPELGAPPPMATAMRVIVILPHRGLGAGIAHSGSLWSSSGSS